MKSWTVAPKRIPIAASWITSPASRPTIETPSTLPLSAVDERGLSGDEREIRIGDGVRARPFEIAFGEAELRFRVRGIATDLSDELAMTIELSREFWFRTHPHPPKARSSARRARS